MQRKYRKNGIWYFEDLDYKKYTFEMETCTDKSKFVPESGDNSQYNGNASGNDPQYDFQDGKPTKNFMLHYARKPGLDITELDDAIKQIGKISSEMAKSVAQDLETLKQDGVTLDQSVDSSK